MIDWQIDSWRKFPIKQVPEYNDQDQVTNVENELSIRPPLVFAEEATFGIVRFISPFGCIQDFSEEKTVRFGLMDTMFF